MKYWETFFMTAGCGMFVGLVITPGSWLAMPIGILCTIFGYALPVWRFGDERWHD